ncbi:MAG: alpha/beta hydrolase [Deltaproteobacteria bacterium]|nr:alpha/beta hydrolase [Deltaproteobacteria bacterium]
MKRWPTIPLSGAMFLITVATVSGLSVNAHSFTQHCSDHTIAVTLPSVGIDATIAGTLCWRGPLNSTRTVQILLHGGTYDRHYWEDAGQPWRYRYGSIATAAGFATFSMDRLGTGLSSHPPGDLVTPRANADAVYGVIEALKGGDIEDVHFERVMLVAHSLGSVVAVEVASDPASYPNAVDGIILTGFLHAVNITGFTALYESQQLGPNDAYPGDSVYGISSYFTSLDGWENRLDAFYLDKVNELGWPTVDYDVVMRDEAVKSTGTTGEAAVLGNPAVLFNPESTIDEIVGAIMEGEFFSSKSLGISVPVLVVMGQRDAAFCNVPTLPTDPFAADCSSAEALMAHEAPFYSPAACLQAVAIANAAHCLNLHTNVLVTDAAMLTWASLYVGANAGRPAPIACP